VLTVIRIGARIADDLFAVQTIVILGFMRNLADGAHPLFLFQIAKETKVGHCMEITKPSFAQRTSCYSHDAN